MAKLLKLRRGTTSQHGSFTGAEGECTVDTDKETLVVHNGSQAGGFPLLRQDLSNLPGGTIDNADVNTSAAIAGTKISPNFGSQNLVTTGNVGIGTGAGTSFPLHVVSNNNNTVLRVESTDADANVGPIIELLRNSGTPADNDALGRIDFRADDAANNESTFARIGVTALDVTNATEDAKIEFTAVANDQFNPSFTITGAGVDVTGAITATSTAAITGAVTCGGLTSNSNITIENDTPSLTLNDSNSENDFRITNLNGTFIIHDNDAGATRMSITSAGQFTFATNVDFSSGIDVTGTITATQPITTNTLTLNSTSPKIEFEESDGNPDYRIISEGGALFFQDADSGPATRIKINSDGHVDILGNLYCNAGIDVTGNITVSGTVDGRDLATDGSKLDGIAAGANNITNNNQLTNGAGYITSASFADVAGGGTFSGDVTFNGGAAAATIGSGSDIRFTSGSWTGESCKIQHNDNILYIQGGSSSDYNIAFRSNAGGDRLYMSGAGVLYPAGNGTQDLGRTGNRFANIYTSDLHLSNEAKGMNNIDGTWGDWTIVEGESDLFLSNNRSGKKYKFNLTEVS